MASDWMRRPAYNPHRSCPKCGHNWVTSKHVTFHYIGLGDAIRRRCERCDYTWDEATRDAEKDAAVT